MHKVPSRLFVKKLYDQCSMSLEDFRDAVDDTVSSEINTLCEKLDKTFEAKTCSKEARSLLTDSFKKFVNRMENNYNETVDVEQLSKNKRTKHYLLFMYYNKINALKAHVDGLSKHLDVSSCDIETFETFKENVKTIKERGGAEAVNARTLRRLFDDTERKKYTSAQKNIILFILAKVIPKLLIAKPPCFKALQGLNICEIVFSERSPRLYSKEKHNSIKKIFKLIEEFKINDDSSHENLGILFLQLFDQLEDAYIVNPDPRPAKSNRDLRKNNDSTIQNQFMMYDASLSTHIVSFMKWIPLLPMDYQKYELMESLEKVIDDIRDYLFSHVNSEFIRNQLNDCERSFFLKDENIELRKMLISALRRNKYIHSQFHSLYE